MTQEKVKRITCWYKENEDILGRMAIKLKSTIEEILLVEKVPYSSVTSRKKDLESLCNKAENPKYLNPVEEIQDVVGIRIVAYVESDVERICRIIENSFYIDIENSEDKKSKLGTDKVGYRSVHYVAKLDENRFKLQEYKLFENLCFEIQVRTLLQHTWAEIEHDRNYKFSGSLPNEIKRKFSLIAGTLELLDNQFDSIAKELDNYKEEVVDRAKKGQIEDIAIDGTSLKAYLLNKFSDKIGKTISPIFGSDDKCEEETVKDLQNFGVDTLQELDDLINRHKDKDIIDYDDNFAGLIINFMLIDNPEKYFKDCWKNSWELIYYECAEKLSKYRPEIYKIFKTYGIEMI